MRLQVFGRRLVWRTNLDWGDKDRLDLREGHDDGANVTSSQSASELFYSSLWRAAAPSRSPAVQRKAARVRACTRPPTEATHGGGRSPPTLAEYSSPLLAPCLFDDFHNSSANRPGYGLPPCNYPCDAVEMSRESLTGLSRLCCASKGEVVARPVFCFRTPTSKHSPQRRVVAFSQVDR